MTLPKSNDAIIPPSCHTYHTPNRWMTSANSSMTEVFSAIGFPARVLGRIPLLFRYAFSVGSKPSSYGLDRYGPSYKYRLWMRLDAMDLESIEMLINYGSDTDIEAFRASNLATMGTTSVVV
jgi:hypothetical protein